MAIPTTADFNNAKRDLDDLAEIVTSPTVKDVPKRLGGNTPTLAKVMSETTDFLATQTQRLTDRDTEIDQALVRLRDHAPVRNRGAWITGTTYEVNDIWQAASDVWYVVVQEYVSGATDVADIAGGKVFVHQVNIATDTVASLADLRLFNPMGDGQCVKQSSDAILGVENHSWFYDAGDSASPDDGIFTVIAASGKRLKRSSRSLNAAMFGVSELLSDNSERLQAAINFVKFIAETKGSAAGIPNIEINGGRYKLLQSITSHPWIKIVSKGVVVLDWSGASDSVDGFICDNNTTIPVNNTIKWAENNSPYLDGSAGAIIILGTGWATSTATGLKIGNFSPGLEPFRLAKIKNVFVGGWDNSQEFGKYDTYLFSAIDCHFEPANTHIKTGSGSQTNSGERMTWINCVFAAAQEQVIYNDIDSFDVTFSNCSFDFMKTVFKAGPNCRFTETKFADCHIEAYDEFIVDASLVTLSVTAAQIHISMGATEVSNTGFRDVSIVSSPSREMFTGPITLNPTGFKRDIAARPYLEDGYAINSSCDVIGRYSEPNLNHIVCPYENAIINEDYDLQKDAVGTLSTGLTYWDEVISTDITTKELALDGGKKVFKVTGTSATTSDIVIAGKNKIPCSHGDRIYCSASVKLGTATGDTITETHIEFFDAVGTSLGRFPAYGIYYLRPAFDDATLPNYSDGGSRYISTHGFLATAPKNAVSCRPRLRIYKFSGDVFISRIKTWMG